MCVVCVCVCVGGVFLFFLSFKVPHTRTLFIGSAHVEQCSMFIQVLLENNRAKSDVIRQFYGCFFFGIYPTLSLLQTFHTRRALLKFPNQVNSTPMNPFVKRNQNQNYYW